MTVGTTMIGLVLIMWSTGVGADMIKPTAAPIIGGLVTSTIQVLIIMPVILAAMTKMPSKMGTLKSSQVKIK